MIAARGVGKQFGGRWIFGGVSLEVPPGAQAVVVGPNGSGKTTLLKILAGLLKPDEGTVEVRGRPPRAGEVLYAHQEPVVLRGTVLDNLKLCPELDWGLVEALGLKPLLGEKAARLSGGYKKLVTIARVAACRPAVALLDEPTAFLDKEKRAAVRSVINELARGGSAVIWTTHYPAEADGAAPLYELIDGVLRPISWSPASAQNGEEGRR